MLTTFSSYRIPSTQRRRNEKKNLPVAVTLLQLHLHRTCSFSPGWVACLDATTLVPSRLEVEGALVLQPPPVAGDASNLLAVVIRGRVRKRRSSRVHAVALDAVEEGGIFLLVHQYTGVISLTNAQLTLPNSAITPRYARLKTWLPKMGPMSQPTANMPTVLIPMSITGSKPPSCADKTES
jgi:hypothetical protein